MIVRSGLVSDVRTSVLYDSFESNRVFVLSSRAAQRVLLRLREVHRICGWWRVLAAVQHAHITQACAHHCPTSIKKHRNERYSTHEHAPDPRTSRRRNTFLLGRRHHFDREERTRLQGSQATLTHCRACTCCCRYQCRQQAVLRLHFLHYQQSRASRRRNINLGCSGSRAPDD